MQKKFHNRFNVKIPNAFCNFLWFSAEWFFFNFNQKLCRRFVHKKNLCGLLIELYRQSSKRTFSFPDRIGLNEWFQESICLFLTFYVHKTKLCALLMHQVQDEWWASITKWWILHLPKSFDEKIVVFQVLLDFHVFKS